MSSFLGSAHMAAQPQAGMGPQRWALNRHTLWLGWSVEGAGAGPQGCAALPPKPLGEPSKDGPERRPGRDHPSRTWGKGDTGHRWSPLWAAHPCIYVQGEGHPRSVPALLGHPCPGSVLGPRIRFILIPGEMGVQKSEISSALGPENCWLPSLLPSCSSVSDVGRCDVRSSEGVLEGCRHGGLPGGGGI